MLLTLNEFNEKMNMFFSTFQLSKISWDKLNDTDKLAALSNADMQFNRLMWRGKKVDDSQVDSWPRKINGKIVETPENVKIAITKYCYDYFLINNSSEIYSIMKGITSKKVAQISESYASIDKIISTDNVRKYYPLICDYIYRGGTCHGW